ncbi:FAD-dependent oxidoreductase [Lentisphaera profundi]|uniref:FAD-dependent oxidoreductase n=1 Tax=Lentisphaera profundi TaxID=1658616 RepID=A0ABY7VYK6_9BACT|nr:FAD-dependent oxidoreductase [Lentisphaera profundi]WDE99182.1 FAD-dependent oxidoreductase [Lentisphaera profundi]
MKEKIIIIGFGMVAKHFCDQFVKLGLGNQYDLIIFSKEKHLAYDRVKLTNYARNNNFDSICLAKAEWFRENDIGLHLGEGVEQVNTEQQKVISDTGKTYSYDKLIFATGSSPFVPPIPGVEKKGVFTYRTIDDADAIRTFSNNKKTAVVIGGGLLGIEAADFLQAQGLSTHIIEMADFLMPKQLTPEASNRLKQQIHKKGFKVHTGTATKEIKNSFSHLEISFKDGSAINCDIIVISAGIRPNHQVAKNAGIDTSLGGGIICNDSLQTSAPNVYAMGECVRHQNTIYGLVAPAYKMAEILASNFSGQTQKFLGADTSTRLKLLGENVVSLGAALQPFKSITYQDENTYRMLSIDQKHLVGAIGIGEWTDLGRIQSAIENRMLLTEQEIKNFLKTGSFWNITDSVERWPDETIICNCLKVTKGEIVQCFKTCNNDIATLKKETGACTACGSCEGLIAQLAGKELELRRKPNRGLLISSCLCLFALLLLFFTPTYWTIDSYDSHAYKLTQSLRSGLWRQITGFTILALSIFAGLISMRKRFKFFRWGSYNLWRLSHAIFALLSLIILMAHTGFSSGKNLNSYLFWTFFTMNSFGVITGFTTSFEFYGTNKIAAFCRRWRRPITFVHFFVFWPLPVLITFHIIQAYYFSL